MRNTPTPPATKPHPGDHREYLVSGECEGTREKKG